MKTTKKKLSYFMVIILCFFLLIFLLSCSSGSDEEEEQEKYTFKGRVTQKISDGFNTSMTKQHIYNNKIYYMSNAQIYYINTILNEVKEIDKGIFNISETAGEIVLVGAKIYFQALNNDASYDLYVLNAETAKVEKKVVEGANYIDGFSYPMIIETKIYFKGRELREGDVSKRVYVGPSIYRLFVLNTITDEIEAQVNYGTSGYFDYITEHIVVGNYAYFRGSDGTSVKIYVLSGIEDKILGTLDNYSGYVENVIRYGSKFYFQGASYNLYCADIEAETISIINSSCDYEKYFYWPVVAGNKIYFKGTASDSKSYIYLLDTETNAVLSKITSLVDYYDHFYYPIYAGESIFFKGVYKLENGGQVDEEYIISTETEEIVRNIESDCSEYTSGWTFPIRYANKIYFNGSGGIFILE